MIAKGMRRIAAKSGTVPSTRITATTLPIYIEAIRPQTKSGRSTKSIGPGLRPQIIRPPIITAGGGARDAERQHRQHGGGAGAMIGGLGRDDAFRLAASEVVAAAREPLRQSITHERGRRRPAWRDPHPDADQAAAHERDPVARQAAERREDADLGPHALEFEALLHGEQKLADAEEPDDDDQKADAAQQFVEAEGEPEAARDRVHSDGREGEPSRIDTSVLRAERRTDRRSSRRRGNTPRRTRGTKTGARSS